ncbi:hypothetical protein [Massilia endophytica]|uniref:hypothetical protein n=1 Tax=Massilia endophytica TaxID=2899220 RepID=UPI001E3C1463|nr:hypothetical protein [Massilia endophytica]UGQ45428.1 hypothetical protein LSQ66_16745 [Massilia endophytica]
MNRPPLIKDTVELEIDEGRAAGAEPGAVSGLEGLQPSEAVPPDPQTLPSQQIPPLPPGKT